MFIPDINRKTVRIPAKVVDGKVEYYYDGHLSLREGALVEIIARKTDVEGEFFQKELDDAETRLFRPRGTVLMAQIEPSGIQEDEDADEIIRRAIRLLVNSEGDPRALGASRLAYFEIVLLKDLRIKLRGGIKKATLESCSCDIPILKTEAYSVNHAYTLLSQDFERRRASHVGNVFTKTFYREKDNWLPLDALRKSMETEKEQKYIRQ